MDDIMYRYNIFTMKFQMSKLTRDSGDDSFTSYVNEYQQKNIS